MGIDKEFAYIDGTGIIKVLNFLELVHMTRTMPREFL